MDDQRRWRYAARAALAAGLSAWGYSAFVVNASLEDTVAAMSMAYAVVFVVVAAVLGVCDDL